MTKGKKSSKGKRTRLSVKKTPPKTVKLLGKKKGKGKTKRKNNVMKGGTIQCDCDDIDKTLRKLLESNKLISNNTLSNNDIIEELNKAKVEGGDGASDGGGEAKAKITELETKLAETEATIEQKVAEAKATATATATTTAETEIEGLKQKLVRANAAVTQLEEAKTVLTPLLAKIDEDDNALKTVIKNGKDITDATTTLDKAKDALIDKLKEIIKE